MVTTEDVAFLNFDLGKDFDELCCLVSGRWITGLSSPYVVFNLCTDNTYSETGQTNRLAETTSFYNNNDRGVYLRVRKLDAGRYESMMATVLMSGTRIVSTGGTTFGVSYYNLFPAAMRFFHIGTHNTSHQYKAGLIVKIWGITK